jgi:hypothetical protein
LKYPPRIRALFRFATRRTPRVRSSPIPPKHSESLFTPPKEGEVFQGAESTAMTADCECPKCSRSMRRRGRGRAVGQIPSLWLTMLSASLLLAELFSRPAMTGRSVLVCSAAALALASATVEKTRCKRLNLASDMRASCDCGSQSHLGATIVCPNRQRRPEYLASVGQCPSALSYLGPWPVDARLMICLHPVQNSTGACAPSTGSGPRVASAAGSPSWR